MKLDQLDKMLSGELDTMAHRDGESSTYLWLKPGISSALFLFNSMVQKFTKGKFKTVFHWLYQSAWREILIALAKTLAKCATPDGGQGVFVCRVMAAADGSPALEVCLCTMHINSDHSGQISPPAEIYTPDTHADRAIAWVDSRKAIGGDLANLMILAMRKPDKPTQAEDKPI